MRAASARLSSVALAVRGDDGLARSALIEQLRASRWFSEVAAHSEGVGTAACLVWDAGLDPASALAALREEPATEVPILMLVADAETGLEALTAGARGTALRESSIESLAAAALAVAAGLAVVDPAHLALLRPVPAELAILTPREREVLELLAQGLSNRTIASQLAISEHTAKFHVMQVMGKLGAQKRVDAVVRAARLGLIQL